MLMFNLPGGFDRISVHGYCLAGNIDSGLPGLSYPFTKPLIGENDISSHQIRIHISLTAGARTGPPI